MLKKVNLNLFYLYKLPLMIFYREKKAFKYGKKTELWLFLNNKQTRQLKYDKRELELETTYLLKLVCFILAIKYKLSTFYMLVNFHNFNNQGSKHFITCIYIHMLTIQAVHIKRSLLKETTFLNLQHILFLSISFTHIFVTIYSRRTHLV